MMYLSPVLKIAVKMVSRSMRNKVWEIVWKRTQWKTKKVALQVSTLVPNAKLK